GSTATVYYNPSNTILNGKPEVAVEMPPIAKVGGLGDVVTSLSRAVQDLGHKVDIILPKYDCINLSSVSADYD
ncbi:hypothetical protein MKX03_001797, partial [Papaver bracteatum]